MLMCFQMLIILSLIVVKVSWVDIWIERISQLRTEIII